MSTDPRIEAAAIALYVALFPEERDPSGWSEVGGRWKKNYRDQATAALAAADKAGTITTVEELDALPEGTVVLSDGYQYSLTYPNYKVSFQRVYDGKWHRGCRASSTHPENIVPARVLHRGQS